MIVSSPIVRPASPETMPAVRSAAGAAAAALEAGFLAEMLKAAGVGEQTSSFAGGVGENHFASFQRQAIAEEMVRNGGIGLAEYIVKAIVEDSNGR